MALGKNEKLICHINGLDAWQPAMRLGYFCQFTLQHRVGPMCQGINLELTLKGKSTSNTNYRAVILFKDFRCERSASKRR